MNEEGFKDGTLVGAEIIGSSLNTDIGFDPGLVDLLEDKSINGIITSPPYLELLITIKTIQQKSEEKQVTKKICSKLGVLIAILKITKMMEPFG